MGGYISRFLTMRVTLANWQFAPLKISTITLGIIIGAYFADFWRPYLWLVGLVFLASSLWITLLWLEAIRQSPREPSHIA